MKKDCKTVKDGNEAFIGFRIMVTQETLAGVILSRSRKFAHAW